MANAKTLRKRIALVAAAVVGVGVLVAAPAYAAALDVTYSATVTSTPAAATNTTPGSAGTAITATLNAITSANVTTTTVTVAPTFTITDPNGTDVTSSATFSSLSPTGFTTTNTAGVYSIAVAAQSASQTKGIGSVTFTPKMGGQYLIKVTAAAVSGTDTSAAVSAATVTTLFVSGAGATVASTGVGTSTVGAVTGGIAKVNFMMAAHAANDVYNLTSSGVGTIQTAAQGVTTVGAPTVSGIAGASDYSQGAKAVAAGATLEGILATVSSNVAGTLTLTWTSINGTTGAPTTVATATITWGAAPAFSAAKTTASLASGAGVNSNSTTDAIVSAAGATTGTTVANILVTVNDQNSNAFGGQTVSATISGPGLLSIQTGNTGSVPVGTVRAVSLPLGASVNTAQIGIAADGTAGVATVTVSVGSTVLGTKTVTFFGALASYTTASTIKTYLGVGENEALTYTGKDSAGNAATLGTLYVSSSNTAVATVTVSGGVVTINGIAPGTANITIGNASSSPTVSTVLAVTVTKITAKTVTMSFDKASYAPGEKMTLTVKATDANGAGVADGARNLFASAVTSNVSLVGTLPSTSVTLTGGQATYVLYAPLAAGTITLTGSEGSSTDNVIANGSTAAATITASAAAVVPADTAVAAAKAAADAAAAAVAQLSVTVASLIASVTAQLRALTIIVKKIQAKLKIK